MSVPEKLPKLPNLDVPDPTKELLPESNFTLVASTAEIPNATTIRNKPNPSGGRGGGPKGRSARGALAARMCVHKTVKGET